MFWQGGSILNHQSWRTSTSTIRRISGIQSYTMFNWCNFTIPGSILWLHPLVLFEDLVSIYPKDQNLEAQINPMLYLSLNCFIVILCLYLFDIFKLKIHKTMVTNKALKFHIYPCIIIFPFRNFALRDFKLNIYWTF